MKGEAKNSKPEMESLESPPCVRCGGDAPPIGGWSAAQLGAGHAEVQRRLLKGGHAALLKPNFNSMNQLDRLLRVAMMAYAKHHLNSPHIGWEELSDALYCEICNTVGGDAFVEWGDLMKEEVNSVDVED